ncbi:exodeoxyribonuclease VII small subunit [Bariatricus massiliensis]|uniref:Exodeoxyribonuclease 7 small subunit n=1 Tax=Bariatricus massiliensis TaxID=1745713 RepID=A0ABS8DD61_9FIRM|nr:exodeoxyribonuclease VII small subunit [Bariatricus massiliensis]MCB7303518.1 exodeoxyribonuclease VII small subunit [Bariatricus massiliensis]MCB7373650.1 exodeoxyribonuclease VII small subunit [Bariatricus massiliensis]MCB7386320.1 exodeoxyribonuclease VII small subunit [Bariatricus massiliensis]MCB7410482.1 exodeoxyribonuclease VII small subunit [Bariatricus massiliensis]MCQ5252234.1 exodeoxyribonuclease VII small subunit [Bariatricus massiliensis]
MEENKETLEELFQSLDDVVEKLEEGETSLEESFRLYQKGMEMLKSCNDKIDAVEKQVLILEENGETHEF